MMHSRQTDQIISARKISKKMLLVSIVTLLTAFTVFTINKSEPIRNINIFNFPYSIEKWTGYEIPMEDWIFESLETPYAIWRNYRSQENNIINLAVVWYDDKEIAFHAPEACLGGVGNKVKEKTSHEVTAFDGSKISVGKLLVDKSGIRNLVYYYYINDGFITSDLIVLRKNLLIKRLLLQRTSAALVRIMATVSQSKEETGKKLDKFLVTTLPIIRNFTDTEKVEEEIRGPQKAP